MDSNDFKVEKSIAAAPSQTPSGIEVPFEIAYEPSNVGEMRATLLLTSPMGGDYTVPLVGTCLPPKPQGPFLIKPNGSTSISFKNVFNIPVTYSFAIDNPLFHVTKTSESLKPHQTHKIVVGFDGGDSKSGDSKSGDIMAKLVITAAKSATMANNIQWIYYLKGVSNT